MKELKYPIYQTEYGYLTETIQKKYITWAIAAKLLPEGAHRMPEILSLKAPNDAKKPIQFWQLYSVLGQDPIVGMVGNFYQLVFADEQWFRDVFARAGDVNHHIGTQASMWLDVMGGGSYYHGSEYRLNFHHTHNAHILMDEKGANLWAELMTKALKSSQHFMTDDPRVQRSINTFLTYFFAKYANDFNFKNHKIFGETNPPFKRKINFMNMTAKSIDALSTEELRDALINREVNLSRKYSKAELVQKALNL